MSHPVKRVEGGKFAPGQSGNPKGRPRRGFTLAERVREHCNPDELIQIALEIARGRPIVDPQTRMASTPKQSDRLAALNFLADRGWGKPLQRVELDNQTQTQIDFGQLSPEELDALDRLFERAAVPPPAGEVKQIKP